MSNIISMQMAASEARKAAAKARRKKRVAKIAPAKLRYRTKFFSDEDLITIEKIPENATQIAKLEWTFCHSDCYLGFDPVAKAFTLYVKAFGGFDDSPICFVAGRLWNYSLTALDVGTMLLKKYNDRLISQDNAPLFFE